MRHFYTNHWYAFFVYLSSFSSLQTSIDLFVQSKIVSEYDKEIPQSQTADRLVHARIHECLSGGQVQARLPENRSDNFCFSPQLILQFYSGLSMVYFKENYFSQVQRGPTFPRGFNFFQGGGLNAFV